MKQKNREEEEKKGWLTPPIHAVSRIICSKNKDAQHILTDDMTTASRSQHRSCIKTSEYPLPCSSVKHKHSYSLRASNRHHVPLLRMISSSSLPLKASTRAAEKPPFTPPPFASHAQQLQPRACRWAGCPGAVPAACKNIASVALDPKQLRRASAERERYRLRVPPRQQQPTSCRTWMCSGCLISTSRTRDI